MDKNVITDPLECRRIIFEELSKLGLKNTLTRRKDIDGKSPYLKTNKKIADYLDGKEPEPIPTREIKK